MAIVPSEQFLFFENKVHAYFKKIIEKYSMTCLLFPPFLYSFFRVCMYVCVGACMCVCVCVCTYSCLNAGKQKECGHSELLCSTNKYLVMTIMKIC